MAQQKVGQKIFQCDGCPERVIADVGTQEFEPPGWSAVFVRTNDGKNLLGDERTLDLCERCTATLPVGGRRHD